MVDYAVENLKSNERGTVDVSALASQMNEDVAALMLTNPILLACSRRRFIRSPTSSTRKVVSSTWLAEHDASGRQSAGKVTSASI